MKKLFLLSFLGLSLLYGYSDKEWEKYGFTYYTGTNYKEAGLSPQEAKKWEDFRVKYAREFIEQGITTPEEAAKWQEVMGSYEGDIAQTKEIRSLGINTPEEAKKWREVTSFIDDFHYLKEWLSVVKTPEEAQQWKKLGMEWGSHIEKDLIQHGINTPEEYKKWLDEGVIAADIGTFIEYGVKTPEEAAKWKSMGVDIRWGFDIVHIMGPKGMGINTPEEYRPYFNTGIHPSDIVSTNPQRILKALKSFGCKKFSSNPDEYANKGLCYTYKNAVLRQRLSEHSGLIDGAYVQFDTPWREGTSRIMIAKGLGSYSYKTVSGAVKVVLGDGYSTKNTKQYTNFQSLSFWNQKNHNHSFIKILLQLNQFYIRNQICKQFITRVWKS